MEVAKIFHLLLKIEIWLISLHGRRNNLKHVIKIEYGDAMIDEGNKFHWAQAP